MGRKLAEDVFKEYIKKALGWPDCSPGGVIVHYMYSEIERI